MQLDRRILRLSQNDLRRHDVHQPFNRVEEDKVQNGQRLQTRLLLYPSWEGAATLHSTLRGRDVSLLMRR
jgi:hypothetical protein